MKEGSFHCSHTHPLIAPQAAPVPMQPRRASGTESRAGMLLSVMISAPTTVHSARTEPTERSMPPVRITNVMPDAKTVLIAICTNIFKKFSGVAKYGAVRQKNNTMRTSATATPASRTRNRSTVFHRAPALSPRENSVCSLKVVFLVGK